MSTTFQLSACPPPLRVPDMRFVPFLLLCIVSSAAQDTTKRSCEDSKCLANVSQGCGGGCFIDVAADTDNIDGNQDSLELLCSEECAVGWSSNATINCLEEEQTGASKEILNLMERLREEVCPIACYLKVVPQDVQVDCFANQGCSEKCKNGLLPLDRECRNVLVRAANKQIKEVSLRVFNACGLEFDDSLMHQQAESPEFDLDVDGR